MEASPGSVSNCRKPTVLVIGPPSVFRVCPEPFTSKFNLLKAFESPLSLPSFLAAGAHDPVSFLALFTSGVSLIIAAGVLDHLPECRRQGITLANAGKIFQDDIADMAVEMTIDVLRRGRF